MKNHHYFIFFISGFLLLVSKGFAQNCPPTIRGTNNGWFTADITYYDCNDVKHVDTLMKHQTKTFAANKLGATTSVHLGGNPPKFLGDIPPGKSFECTGYPPQAVWVIKSGAKKGRCDVTGSF